MDEGRARLFSPLSVAGCWRRDERRLRVYRQHQRRSGYLGEVEVVDQVAKLGHVFPHVRTGVRPSVSLRVKSLTMQEIVLDKLEIGVEAQRLVVDITAFRVRTDDKSRHADTVT